MKIFGKSDVGTVRTVNEDTFGIRQIATNAFLATVCDGMGGLDLGDVASNLALESFCASVSRSCKPFIKNGLLELNEKEANLILYNAATTANELVIRKQEETDVSEGMGTTLVAALIIDDGKQVSWINIGDSRLYTLDSNDVLQVSKDHSYVQYMIDQGKMTLEEAKRSKKKNLITRAIGIDPVCEPNIDTFALSKHEAENTYLILCSDGFSNAVSEEDCADIVLSASLDTEKKVNTLIELAKSQNGSDNITLILAELGDGHGEI